MEIREAAERLVEAMLASAESNGRCLFKERMTDLAEGSLAAFSVRQAAPLPKGVVADAELIDAVKALVIAICNEHFNPSTPFRDAYNNLYGQLLKRGYYI